MTDTYEATTELGKAMNVVQQSAEGLAHAFGEMSDESKVWTIASRILSGSGLWKLQNRIRALGQIQAWYNRIQLQSIQNQVKGAEANLQQKKTLELLAKGKKFEAWRFKKGSKDERFQLYSMYRESFQTKYGKGTGKASARAEALVKEQYGAMHKELEKNQAKVIANMMKPKRLMKWLTKGETFDEQGESQGKGKSFFLTELTIFWKQNKLRKMGAWIKDNMTKAKIWGGILKVGGGLKRIVSAAGYYFVTAMYYFVIISVAITLIVAFVKQMKIGEKLRAFEDKFGHFGKTFDGFIKMAKGMFGIIKAALSGDLPGLWENLKKFFGGLKDMLWHGLMAFGGILGTLLWGIVTGLLNSLIMIINKISPFKDIEYRFAKGGIAPGGMVLVGERGPELVNLPRGSRVHSNAASRGMGGNTIHVHINGRVGASDAEIRDIANKVARELNLKMNRTGATAGRF